MNKSKSNIGENKSRADESWYADRKDKKSAQKNAATQKGMSSDDKSGKRV